MRHTFANRLAIEGVAEEIRAVIAGQDTGGGVNSAVYAKLQSNVSLKIKVMERCCAEYVALLDRAVTETP